jgi:hypothetical protein
MTNPFNCEIISIESGLNKLDWVFNNSLLSTLYNFKQAFLTLTISINVIVCTISGLFIIVFQWSYSLGWALQGVFNLIASII